MISLLIFRQSFDPTAVAAGGWKRIADPATPEKYDRRAAKGDQRAHEEASERRKSAKSKD